MEQNNNKIRFLNECAETKPPHHKLKTPLDHLYPNRVYSNAVKSYTGSFAGISQYWHRWCNSRLTTV